jgi:hypothetical protein
MKIKISKEDILKASDAGVIDAAQAETLWTHLAADNDSGGTPFTGVNVAYYLGAFVIILAMTWFATEAFANFSSIGLMIISLVYFAGFSQAGRKLYEHPSTRIPGGLLLTIAVFMVPLFIFSCQHYAGVWGTEEPGSYKNYFEWVKGGWFLMELGTIVTALVFLYRYDFPFLTFPLAFTLWFLSMDITALIYGDASFTGKERETVSMFFGLGMLVAAYFIDRRTAKDYAFWLYLFGLIAFWFGLSLMGSGSEWGKFIYFCINLALIAVSVLFGRKVFLVFGALGAFGYLGYLAMEVFGDSLMFPIVLTLFGLAIIYLGIKYARNQARIESFVQAKMPAGFSKLLPPNRS